MLTFLSNNWIWFVLCAVFFIILAVISHIKNMKNHQKNRSIGSDMFFTSCFMFVGGICALFASIGIITDIIKFIIPILKQNT